MFIEANPTLAPALFGGAEGTQTLHHSRVTPLLRTEPDQGVALVL